MNEHRATSLARMLAGAPSRRHLLRGLAAAGLVWGAAPRPAAAANRRKKIAFNEFGCINVGKLCKTDDQCCSGICQGKKGKKRCKAHGAAGCNPGVQDSSCGTDANPGTNVVCTTATGNADGLCGTTTGNAGYCLYTGECYPCRKDAECQEYCGPKAACIRCDGCTETGGRSCAMPENTQCDFPAFV